MNKISKIPAQNYISALDTLERNLSAWCLEIQDRQLIVETCYDGLVSRSPAIDTNYYAEQAKNFSSKIVMQNPILRLRIYTALKQSAHSLLGCPGLFYKLFESRP